MKALTAAALLLPGLLQAPAYAEEDNEVDFQYSHYQEGKRNLATIVQNPGGIGMSMTTLNSQYHPIEVDSLHGGSKITLADCVRFAFNYTQDTWSGATPIATAPAAFGGNLPFISPVGSGAISGASPMIQRLPTLIAFDA